MVVNHDTTNGEQLINRHKKMNKNQTNLPICGIDEAGRGPLAGSLVVAGVVLLKCIEDIADSKKITQIRREKLFPVIKSNTKHHIVTFSSSQVDEFGISHCMKSALQEIKEYFGDCHYIFDGNTNFGIDGIDTLVKADAKVPEVGAASILAKVTHDNEMIEISKEYPEYGFERHKGYSTKLHREAIIKYGRTPYHRYSFYV